MGIEIERKFLVKNDRYKTLAESVLYIQGFLSTQKERVVRVRVVGEEAYLTIKGRPKESIRNEFEYQIPVKDAEFMLNELCEKPNIKKHRYTVNFKGFIWEIDEFCNENEGLVIAEIELENEDQQFEIPPWVDKEVTGEEKYYNASLIHNPFKKWH